MHIYNFVLSNDIKSISISKHLNGKVSFINFVLQMQDGKKKQKRNKKAKKNM